MEYTLEAYRNMLDEIYPPVEIGELCFAPSQVIEECDPIAFRVGFNDWLDYERAGDDE